MKKLYRAAAALALVFTLALSACTGSRDQTEYKTEITVMQTETVAVQYSQEVKEECAQSFLNVVGEAISSVYGEDAAPIISRFYDCVMLAADCCEQRGVSESGLLAITDAICARLAADYTQMDMYAAVQLFAEITGITGADTACRLIYDFSLIYCGYEYDRYMQLYSNYSYPYLLRYANAWQDREQHICKIGEDNFVYLLKTLVSATTIVSGSYEDSSSFMSGFSAGEAALYLRAQGYMMGKLTLDSDDWQFVFTAAGDSGYFEKLTALCSAGAEELLAQNFAQLVSGVAYALANAHSSCAQALYDGDISAFLKRLLSCWTDEEWAAFAAVAECGIDGAACEEYFAAAGVSDEYEQFAQSVACVTLQQLINSEEEDFYDALKGYVASCSVQLSFILFEL